VASWGDWKAKEIFWTAGRELGQAGVAVIKRLQMEQDDFAVIPFGGVFKSGELVLGAFENTIRAAAPHSSVIEPRFEPAVGAVLLALGALEVEIDPFVLKNLERTTSRFAAARLDYFKQEGSLDDSH
jgi:N-acetylglucosamine kinase-like BadF-type ATPase